MTDHCGTPPAPGGKTKGVVCRDNLLSCFGGMPQAIQPNKEFFQIAGMSTAVTEQEGNAVQSQVLLVEHGEPINDAYGQ